MDFGTMHIFNFTFMPGSRIVWMWIPHNINMNKNKGISLKMSDVQHIQTGNNYSSWHPGILALGSRLFPKKV